MKSRRKSSVLVPTHAVMEATEVQKLIFQVSGLAIDSGLTFWRWKITNQSCLVYPSCGSQNLFLLGNNSPSFQFLSHGVSPASRKAAHFLRPAFANAKGSVQSVSENLSRAYSSYWEPKSLLRLHVLNSNIVLFLSACSDLSFTTLWTMLALNQETFRFFCPSV